MDVRGARQVRAREPVESWFVEQGLAKDEQETSIDFGKRLSSEFMMPLKEKVDKKKKEKVDKKKEERVVKAKLFAVEALDGERKLFSSAAAAETAIDKIQTEKMDRTMVEVVDGEKKRFSTITSGAPVETGKAPLDSMQTEKMDKCAESDPPAAVNGKHCLNDDYVRLVLAMPREIPMETEDLSFITDLAKLMNRSEDWIEERKQRYLERAALSKSNNELFVEFQDSMRKEWLDKGYVEMDCDFDYEAREAMVEELNRELCEQHKRGRLARQKDNMMATA